MYTEHRASYICIIYVYVYMSLVYKKKNNIHISVYI